jgi:hypothetical protein
MLFHSTNFLVFLCRISIVAARAVSASKTGAQFDTGKKTKVGG